MSEHLRFRRIDQGDIGAVAAFAIEGMKAEMYALHIDRAKVVGVIERFIAPSHDRFQLAAFDGARMVGAIAAVVMPMLFFERSEAHVVLCRATAAGAGRRLLRELLRWFKADMRIRRLVWAMEFHADPRIARMAARMGFDNALTVCSAYK